LSLLGNEAIITPIMDASNFSLTPATPLEPENVEFSHIFGRPLLDGPVATLANVDLFT
jgi:hypothetical protein